MKKKYIVAVLAVMMMVVLSGCSMENIPSFQAMMLGEPEMVDLAYDPLDYVTLGKYKDIEVECSVTEDDLRDALDSLLAEGKKDVRIEEGTVQKGQTVNIDYVGKIDGKAFDGGSAEDQQLRIGSGKMIDGFEDALVGVKVGETKDASLKFPEDYGNNELAGKDVVFTLTVNYIYKEATDELVKKYSDYDTVEAYKEAQKKTLESEKEQEALSTAMEKVYEGAEFKEVPKELLSTVKNMVSTQLESTAQQYGVDVATLLSFYGMTEDSYYESCAKERLLVEAIAQTEGYRVTEQDYEEKLAEVLKNYDMDEATYRSSFKEAYGDSVSFEDSIVYNMKYDYYYDLVNNTLKKK